MVESLGFQGWRAVGFGILGLGFEVQHLRILDFRFRTAWGCAWILCHVQPRCLADAEKSLLICI